MTTPCETSVSLETKLRNAGLDWIVPDWGAPSVVHAVTTTRNGGCSGGSYSTMNLGSSRADDPAAVEENHRRFEAFLPTRPVWLRQVHGADVATLTDRDADSPPVADAAVTRRRKVVCAILTADCLPVVFADEQGSAVGIAHAGWRGIAGGVLEATVRALRGLDVPPERLLAWLGPGIGPHSFEVGDEVREAFLGVDREAASGFVQGVRPHKWQADLYALARQRLFRAGVTRISGGHFCTYTQTSRFFSYRRERESGRMATAVWLV